MFGSKSRDEEANAIEATMKAELEKFTELSRAFKDDNMNELVNLYKKHFGDKEGALPEIWTYIETTRNALHQEIQKMTGSTDPRKRLTSLQQYITLISKDQTTSKLEEVMKTTGFAKSPAFQPIMDVMKNFRERNIRYKYFEYKYFEMNLFVMMLIPTLMTMFKKFSDFVALASSIRHDAFVVALTKVLQDALGAAPDISTDQGHDMMLNNIKQLLAQHESQFKQTIESGHAQTTMALLQMIVSQSDNIRDQVEKITAESKSKNGSR